MKQYFYNTLLIFLLFFCNNIFSQDISRCDKLLEESEVSLKDIKCKIDELPEPYYLNKTELFSIVVPEFILYSSFNKYIEKIYLEYAIIMNHDAYLSTSIGPFQMTPRFILSCIQDSPESIIKDSLMKEIKEGDYKILYENIDYFTKIDVQWKILILFENILWDSSDDIINKMRRIYHSGDNGSYIFTKIDCYNETYDFWSDYLINFYSKL